MDKNQSVEIKFVGKKNTVFNVVSYEQFERVYKPKGWILKDSSALKESKQKNEKSKQEEPKEEIKLEDKSIEEIIEEIKTTDETEIKNIAEAKKKSTEGVEFNDKLIKE